MGSKKSGRTKRARAQYTDGFSDFSVNFSDLKTLFASPEGIKPQVLKNFYGLLVHLSSNGKCGVKFAVDSHDFELQFCHDEINVTFVDIVKISDILFKELGEGFEQFFTKFSDKDVTENSSYLALIDNVDVIHFLLRCCLLLLPLLASRQSLMLKKGQIILNILGRLSSPNLADNKPKQAYVFEKSVFRGCSFGNYKGCTSSSVEDITASLQILDPYYPPVLLISTVLEVFVDELSMHKQLRGYLKLIRSATSEDVRSDISIIIEAICNHFILSFSDKTTRRDFLNRLFLLNNKEISHPFRAPALGVTAAVSLLLSPIMNSAPKYLQAHLISLVTEALDIKILEPDFKLTNCFLAAFEKSVILYMEHTRFLQLDGSSHKGFNSSSKLHGVGLPQFEQYISAQTKDKVNNLIAGLDHSSNSNMMNRFFRMKSDLVTSSMRFLKECQKVHSVACQDEILAILSCLVLKGSESFNSTEVKPIDGESVQDVYLLASILKLMSISLLQAISCLRERGDPCGLNTFKDLSSCGEYKFILETIACFSDLNISLPLQQLLFNVLAKDSTRHAGSKMMLLHFSGLMSLTFASGLDCLVKGCLLALFALLNLFAFEEGGLAPLQTLLDSNRESFSSGSLVVRLQETVVDQLYSSVLAAKFQKIRSLYTSVEENNINHMIASTSESLASALDMEGVVDLEEETEETSNGEIFLNCMVNKKEKIGDFEDLAGFIECRQGKDYSAWLKNRERYRKWKFEKRAVLKWKRKKMTWKTCKRNRD